MWELDAVVGPRPVVWFGAPVVVFTLLYIEFAALATFFGPPLDSKDGGTCYEANWVPTGPGFVWSDHIIIYFLRSCSLEDDGSFGKAEF